MPPGHANRRPRDTGGEQSAGCSPRATTLRRIRRDCGRTGIRSAAGTADADSVGCAAFRFGVVCICSAPGGSPFRELRSAKARISDARGATLGPFRPAPARRNSPPTAGSSRPGGRTPRRPRRARPARRHPPAQPPAVQPDTSPKVGQHRVGGVGEVAHGRVSSVGRGFKGALKPRNSIGGTEGPNSSCSQHRHNVQQAKGEVSAVSAGCIALGLACAQVEECARRWDRRICSGYEHTGRPGAQRSRHPTALLA